jgi:Ni,Fe-hydrogenase III component G
MSEIIKEIQKEFAGFRFFEKEGDLLKLVIRDVIHEAYIKTIKEFLINKLSLYTGESEDELNKEFDVMLGHNFRELYTKLASERGEII